MQKKTLLFTLIAAMVYISLSSYKSGPAFSGLNITGSDASPTSCVTAGCHSGGPSAPTINIRVDSVGGVEVNKYAPGKTYTVTVTASHALNKFGFQFAAVTGTGAAQFNAGTYGSFPTQVAERGIGGIRIVEHTGTISGPLSKSFAWTAPSTAGGDVTMYLTVNAVNGDLNPTGDISENMNKVLPQYPLPSTVTNVTGNISIAAFPNPTTDVLHIQATNIFGNYTVQVSDLAGRSVLNTTANGIATINTANWPSGTYNVVVTGETGSKTIQVVKQ